jgi:hypothetical protein
MSERWRRRLPVTELAACCADLSALGRLVDALPRWGWSRTAWTSPAAVARRRALRRRVPGDHGATERGWLAVA